MGKQSEHLKTPSNPYDTRHPDIAEIVRRDGRYAYEAYVFIVDALAHTQRMLGRLPAKAPVELEPSPPDQHVTGAEISRGAVDLAQKEFGLMARTVFHQWGIHTTDDLGEIVFNLIEAELLSKTETDNRADFQGVFDLERALIDGYTIAIPSFGDNREARR